MFFKILPLKWLIMDQNMDTGIGNMQYDLRFVSSDVPIVESQQREKLYPSGLSKVRARELLQSIDIYINRTQHLDERSKEFFTEQTSKQIKDIFKAQKIEDIYNLPHLPCSSFNSLKPSFLEGRENTYNCEKVFAKSKIIFRQVMPVENIGLKAFLSQLHSFDLSNFSPSEYNMIVHMSLSKNIRDKVELVGGLPIKMSTGDYLEIVNRAVHGNISMLNIDEKFMQFRPKSRDILSIWHEYLKFSENIPDKIITDQEKDRKIIYEVSKFIPYNIRPLLDATAAMQNNTLTLIAFENFITLHQNYINGFLSKGTGYQTEYITKNDSDCFLEKVKTSEIYK